MNILLCLKAEEARRHLPRRRIAALDTLVVLLAAYETRLARVPLTQTQGGSPSL